MKSSDIYDVISGIDEKYRTCSGDFQRIASDFKRARIRRAEGYISLAASFVLVVFAGLNIYDTNSIINQSDILLPASETVSVTEYTSAENTYSVTITETTIPGEKETADDGAAGKPGKNANTAVSSTAENSTAADKKGTDIYGSNDAHTAASGKNTVKADSAEPAGSKITAKTENNKTTVSSVPVSEGKTKPAVTTAAQTDKDNNTAETEVSDVNEGFEDPVLDEIVISGKFDNYTYLVGDRIYSTGAKMMDADSVGEKIDRGIVLRKYSKEENQMYYMKADTYKIKNVSDEFAVAVKFPKINTFYLYKNLNYKCDTLGKLIYDLDLENTLYIDAMYVNLGENTRPFDRELVKSFIMESRNAADDGNFSGCRCAMRFKVNVELLGIYNRQITIFKNGYIYTTLDGFDKKGFYIGEEAVQRLADALSFSLDY